MPDVEMKTVEDKAAADKTKEEITKPPSPPSPETEIRNNVALIERAVSTLEPRFTHRVLRNLASLRKRATSSVLRNAVESIYPKGGHSWLSTRLPDIIDLDSATKQTLLSWLLDSGDASMDVDGSSVKPATSEPVPESEMYLRLLIIHHLLAEEDTQEKALELANETVEKMQALNRRSMDAIAAKIWYAVDRAYDLGGEHSDARP